MIQNIVESVRQIIPGAGGEAAPVIPVVRLAGAIGKAGRFQSGLSLATMAGPLKKAFAIKSAPAVALIVDSPGGSPVQSHLIFKRIRALAEEKEKPVLVFVEDVCASGGYMIACAGDEIIVDEASIVGSIGVVSAGFGFADAIKKLGVERRVYTAGESKAILDPFQPEKKADVERLKAIQEEIHDMFIDLVKARRGDVLRRCRWFGACTDQRQRGAKLDHHRRQDRAREAAGRNDQVDQHSSGWGGQSAPWLGQPSPKPIATERGRCCS